MPTVVPADSRPLSWPPIGALPRNRLASPATGGASPISPTPRLHRTPCPASVGRGALTPPHDTHRTAPQKLSLRGAQRRGNPSSPSRPPRNSPCVGAGFYPARLYRTPHPPCRGRRPRRPAYAAPPTLSLRTGAHTGVAIRNIHTPHLQPCHCEERSDVAIRPPQRKKPPRQSGGAIPFFTQYVFSQLSVRCRHSSS